VFSVRRHSQCPALRVLRRWGRWLSTVAVIAVVAVAARAAGTTRAEGPGTGPTGTRARGKRPARIERPRTRRRAAGSLGIERTVNAVVVRVMVMPADCGAGEEDHRHHENDACDDHHPRRHLIQPRMFCRVRRGSRIGRRRRARRRRERRFGCLGHASIMPRHGPAINQLPARVGRRSAAIRSSGTYRVNSRTPRRISE
jgi:hypothetical protein